MSDVTPQLTQLQSAADGLKDTIARIQSWERFFKGKAPSGASVAAWRKRAALVQRASRRKPAVGVYGESQIGKSYLISALATESPSIMIKTPGAPAIGFLEKLNPEQGAESTGLITRFTNTESVLTGPQQDALFMELLNFEDLVLAFIYGVSLDVEELDPLDRQIEERAKAIFKEMKVALAEALPDHPGVAIMPSLQLVVGGLGGIRVALRGECREEFKDLLQQYTGLGRRPNDTLLVRFVSLLWGGDECRPLCDLFLRLLGAMLSMEGVEVVEVPCDAVVGKPEQVSLLNVAMLGLLADPARSGRVTVWGRHLDESSPGAAMTVSRAELAALVSELVLTTAESASTDGAPTLIQRADILDFPGSRAKGRGTPMDKVKDEEATKIFLRGKLTQIYRKLVLQDEIGVLMLGVTAQGNTEASQPTQRAIELWLQHQQQGGIESPPLIAVFTKCDGLLVEGESQARTDIAQSVERMFEKLKSYSGELHNWLEHWPGIAEDGSSVTQHARFSNVICVFNPKKADTPKFRSQLDEYVRPAAGHAAVRARCSRPDPWVTGLAAVDSNGNFSGNIKSLKDACIEGIAGVRRQRTVARRYADLTGDIDAFYRPRYRHNALSEADRAKLRAEGERLCEALSGAAKRRFGQSTRNGMAELQRLAAVSPGIVEAAAESLREAAREGSAEASPEALFEFTVEQWDARRRLDRERVAGEIDKLFGAASGVREFVWSLPRSCKRFREHCTGVIEDRIEYLGGRRVRTLCVAVSEAWNTWLVDWGFAMDACTHGQVFVPEGDMTRHPAAWILEHWSTHVVELKDDIDKPGGDPPKDNELVKDILDSVSASRALLDGAAGAEASG